MREILFRGKHIHAIDGNSNLGGKWVYGYLCSESYIYAPELEGEMLIDPETVGQYTGLTDKNGKKIFEGDIMKYKWNGKENIDVIEFKSPMFSPSMVCRWSLYQDEVIGNIHDNPELLENNS